MRHYRRYRKLLSGYRYLPGSIRNYLQSSGRCYYGNQILHRNRTDAASICSWCSGYFYRSRLYLLQSVILWMRNCVYRTFCTGIPVPAARCWPESIRQKRGSDRQPEAYPFLFRVHRHDPDRIHLHRYLPAVAELCAELCKRKCRLGESVHHADLLFSRNHAGTRCNRIPDQKNQRRSFHRCLPGYLPCNNDRCPDGTE